MADAGERISEQLSQITECSICMSVFTDPRMLPCIHTFCFQCLKYTAETAEREKKPVEKMPCPLCRKEFIIPPDGITGLQKNFFMENLLELKNTLQVMDSATIVCDMCKFRNKHKAGKIPAAVMRCTVCRDNYCDSCVKDHQQSLHTLNGNHKVIKIESEPIYSGSQRITSVKSCNKHIQKPLDYYCSDCKKIVCVSCFVEGHKLHDCKDVTTVDEEFRQTIEKKAWLISTFADELMSMRKNTEKKKIDFLQDIVKSEKVIHKRNQRLKELIDRCTKLLLDELSAIKSNHLKQIESEMEEIERSCTIMKSFEAYCTELRLKGSASDICSSVDQLLDRADDLERDHEAIIGRPYQSVEVSFQTTDFLDVSQKSNKNFVGQIKKTTSQFEDYAVVVGLDDGLAITKEVIKINIRRPNEISTQEEIGLPTKMQMEAVAAVYRNKMYVTGLGAHGDEVWKYSFVCGWVKCASLVQGRSRHSAAFIDAVLYICGGFVDTNKSVLHSVEAYNAITNKCAVVGKLVHCVESSGNCVPFKSSLYIFGGSDKEGNVLNCVQVYNAITNTCSVLSKPMPWPNDLMRAVIWETSVILVGYDTCCIFNFETEKWQERKRFKTDVVHFGLLLENGRVFVIGGGIIEEDKDGNDVWICRDDVRYVPIQHIINDKQVAWKIHGKLPKPATVHAYATMRF